MVIVMLSALRGIMDAYSLIIRQSVRDPWFKGIRHSLVAVPALLTRSGVFIWVEVRINVR